MRDPVTSEVKWMKEAFYICGLLASSLEFVRRWLGSTWFVSFREAYEPVFVAWVNSLEGSIGSCTTGFHHIPARSTNPITSSSSISHLSKVYY